MMPNEQVPERRAIRRAIPGSIERRAFNDTRDVTVTILTFFKDLAHIMASWPEYNRLYAHPFEWIWTNQKMRRWFVKHAH
jgi:hypothetical protein